jgi:hypothetical protein
LAGIKGPYGSYLGKPSQNWAFIEIFYWRAALFAHWHFSPQFVEEVFEEDQVVLRLLGFLAFGRHERGDAFAVRPNPHDNPTLIASAAQLKYKT